MNLNLDSFHQWLKMNKDSKKTVSDYFQQVSLFFKHYNEFNQKNINEYITKLIEDGKSKYTINAVLSALRQYAVFGKLKIDFPKNRKTKKRAIKFYFTAESIQEIYKNLPLLTDNYQEMELVLKFMFYTGARTQDVLELKKSHIKFDKHKVIFYNGKGDKDRSVPFLDKNLMKELKNHCKFLDGDKVFSVNRGQLQYLFKKIQKHLKLKDEVIEPRTMRISFAKYCVGLGINLLVIKQYMGHTDIKTTEIYAEADEKMCDEVARKIREGK